MQTPRAPRRVTPGARPARPAWRRWRPVGLAWALWALAMLSVPMAAWLDHLLRQAGRPDLLELTPTAIPPVLGAVSAATVGAVLATRRPRHPVGWLLLALGLSLSASGPAEAYTNYAVASPGAPPAASLVALYMPATVVAAFACIGFVLLLTPTGTLPSPRWRWWARAMVATPVALLLVVTLAPRPGDQPSQTVDNPLDLHALSGVLLIANQAAFAVTIIAFVAAAASLVLRFRRARGTERQQLRWVALATVVVSLLFVVVLAALALETFALAALAASLCVAVLPLAIGAAILRYRLYDLDRIISRTLSYGLLTVLLGGGYAGVVLGFGGLLGRASSLAVAGATLAVAVAFQPARRRIQQLVDRRFNRHRYDAAQTIARFSARLRQAIDLDALTAELLAVVDQTMQPTQVSLWLRPSPPHGSPNAAWTGDGRTREPTTTRAAPRRMRAVTGSSWRPASGGATRMTVGTDSRPRASTTATGVSASASQRVQVDSPTSTPAANLRPSASHIGGSPSPRRRRIATTAPCGMVAATMLMVTPSPGDGTCWRPSRISSGLIAQQAAVPSPSSEPRRLTVAAVDEPGGEAGAPVPTVTYTPARISAMPRTVTAPGISPRVTAARMVPNSGVAASSGLVRAAPMRFWLAFSSVQPTEKCTSPAPRNAASASGVTARSSLRSSVASVPATSTTLDTASWRKVDRHTSMPRTA